MVIVICKIVCFLRLYSLSHSLPRGKSGVIEIQTGAAPSIGKTKTGHLLVVSQRDVI